MNILTIIFVYIATADLLIGPFVSGQDCNTNTGNTATENWCNLSPPSRNVLQVSRNNPGRIKCSVSSKGLDIWIINQFGERVRRDKALKQHVKQVSTGIHSTNKTFELEISWPEDSETQGRLKILQCIAFFYQATHPCRTSLVNIEFVDDEDATTTTTEASTTTTKFDTEATTTAANADTTTTNDNQQTDTEEKESQSIVERRSVRQANARIAHLRSIEQSDIYSNGANLSPNVLLLLLALCLIVYYL